jgi:phosphoribosylanthranilate isomerase
MVTRVKICGITRQEDAELAISLGAHALGFIFEPSSKRYLAEPPDWIFKLAPYVARVAVFGTVPSSLPQGFHAVQGGGFESSPANARVTKPFTAPHHSFEGAVWGGWRSQPNAGDLDPSHIVEDSSSGRSSIQRVSVARVKSGDTVESVISGAGHADALLLDAFASGSYGGTGHCIDWDFAAQVVEVCPKPVILAGGLTPENVAEAIRRVRPYAVDVCTGVESSDGIKDAAKLRALFGAVNNR